MSQSHTRRLSMAACAGMFVFGLANALLGAILPILSTRIPFDIAQSGLLFLILNFGVLLCVLGMGPLIDRTGMKWPMVAGPITVALCLVLLQLAASYSTLAATCFLLGLGGGALNAATNTLVADLHADVRHKNAALTFLGVFFGAGALLVPFGIGSLLNESGLAPILYSCAVLCLGAGLYPVQLVFPSPKYTAQMPGLRADRHILVFALLLFLQSGSEIVLAGYTTTYVMETLHAPVTTANWLLTSLWISVMLARLVLARILPGASGHTVLIGSALCSAAGAAAFLLAQSLEAALAGMLLTGAGMAGIFPTLMGMAGARFQANSGTAFGVLLTAGRFGAMLVPFMVGHAAAWVGLSWSLSAVIWSSLLIAAIQWRRGEELEPI